MGTKVRFKNIDGVVKSINEAFQKTRTNSSLLNQMGTTHVKRIQLEARRGKRMVGLGKSDGNLPLITDFTVKARKILAPYNKTNRAFRKNRNRSNLTFTGELLGGLYHKPKKSDGSYIITFRGTRSQLIVPDKERFFRDFANEIRRDPGYIGVWKLLREMSGQGESRNVSVYRKLLDLNRGYRILGINDKLKKTLNNQVLRYLRRALRSRGF